MDEQYNIVWHKVEGNEYLRPDALKEGETVWVCWINEPEWGAKRMSIMDSDEGWIWACDEFPYDGELWDGERPTHWMYPPKPPKE